MKTIYKYYYENSMMLPKGAEILSFGQEKNIVGGDDSIIFWAIVDTEAPEERMNFICIGTGREFGSENIPKLADIGKYLGRIDQEQSWGMTERWHMFAPRKVGERERC